MKDKKANELYQFIEEHEAKWRIDHIKRYEYENRINKAIKLLKEAGCYDEETKHFCDDIWDELSDLLNILLGDNDE